MRRAPVAYGERFPILGMPVWNPVAEPPLTHDEAARLMALVLGPPTVTRSAANGTGVSAYAWRAVSLPASAINGSAES